MKNIDVKSLLIGALLTSTIFLGVAAVPQHTGETLHAQSKWGDKQQWTVVMKRHKATAEGATGLEGYQPFGADNDSYVYWRKRIK